MPSKLLGLVSCIHIHNHPYLVFPPTEKNRYEFLDNVIMLTAMLIHIYVDEKTTHWLLSFRKTQQKLLTHKKNKTTLSSSSNAGNTLGKAT